MKKLFTIICFCLMCHIAVSQPTINLVSFATGFTGGITDITSAGDSRLFVVEQLGDINIVDTAGTVNPVPFLDISNKVTVAATAGSERGLLGLAFSPDYATNGYFYVNYTNKTGVGNSVISRFSVSATNPNMADTSSEEILMTIYQPYSNHNGGSLAFGPDGYLYIGLGDGGSGGDPQNRAQNPDTLLGKILRIDVTGVPGYAIPPTNPFALSGGAPEIWAIGLRNPWRISFDRTLGNLWIGDVGQNQWEEIDMEPAGSAGGNNYGWRCYEGTYAYNTSGCLSSGNYTPPVHEYSHVGAGGCSVTGGYVYRGSNYPDLIGYYFFTDYCSGIIYSISSTNVATTAGTFPGKNFSTFGENTQGELFVGNLSNGTVYRIASTFNSLEDLTGDIKRIAVYPNPNQGLFTCHLEAVKTTTSRIIITDITGRECYVKDQNIESGPNSISINMADKAAGAYLLKITTESSVLYEQFEVLK